MSVTAKYIVWHDNNDNTDKKIMVDYAKCDSEGNSLSGNYVKKLTADDNHMVGTCELPWSETLATDSNNYKATLTGNVVIEELKKFCSDNTYYLPIVKIISDDGTINIVCNPIISDGYKFGFKNYIDSTQIIVNTSTGEIVATADANKKDSITLTFYFDTMED